MLSLSNFFLIIYRAFRSPFLLCVFLALPIIVWNLHDSRVWLWDQSWYGQESFNLYYLLFSAEYGSYFDKLITVFAFKAPLIAWLGQFFAPLTKFGLAGSNALLVQNSVLSVMTLIVLYKSFFKLTGSYLSTIVGILAIASAPMFIGLHEEFFVESLQTFSVSVFIYLYSSVRERTLEKNILYLLFFMAFAMAAKATSPIYVYIYGLLFLMGCYRQRASKGAKGCSKILYLVICLFCFLTCIWYYENISELLVFVKGASAGENAKLYSRLDNFEEKLSFWKSQFLASALGGYYRNLLKDLVCGLFVFATVYSIYKRKKLVFHKYYVPLLQGLPLLFLFSTQVNEETRYLMPILPTFALFITLVINQYKNVLIKILIISVFFVQYTSSIQQNFSHKVRHVNNPWFKVIKKENDEIELVEKIIKITCYKSSRTMFTIDYPRYNNVTYNFYAQMNKKRWELGCDYKTMGYALKDIEIAKEAYRKINPDYIISMKPEKIKKNAFNAVSALFLDYLISTKSYTEIYENSEGIIVLERNKR